MGAVDASAARKDHDSPVGVLLGGQLAARLVPLAAASGLGPVAWTLLSLALTIGAAALIAAGTAGLVALLLIAAGFVCDCLDGQVARATGRVSDFGRWLDSMTDLAKVIVLLAALTHAAGPDWLPVGMLAVLGYGLCELHVQLARQLPQRSQGEYVREAAPWKARLRLGGQQIDLAYAIGEVLATIAVAAALGRPGWGLAVVAALTPIQLASYATRFWRHRYARSD